MNEAATAAKPVALDEQELRSAIADADLRVLLMVLFHLTGNRRWLCAPYRPKRDVNLVADPTAGLDGSAQDAIRARALELLRQPAREPVITDLGDALMREMMNACLGEDVPAEYAPVTREEMGLVSRDLPWCRALLESSVELVTEPIAHIAEDAVVTRDGTHRAADVLVMATGFKVGEMAARLGVTGRDGRELASVWADDNPTAYVGLTVPGFPNFFCMLGPNSGLGHGGSTLFQAECQARYASACLVQTEGDAPCRAEPCTAHRPPGRPHPAGCR